MPDRGVFFLRAEPWLTRFLQTSANGRARNFYPLWPHCDHRHKVRLPNYCSQPESARPGFFLQGRSAEFTRRP